MVIFTKRAIITILLSTAFSLGLLIFLSWSAVYAVNVEDETIAYVDSFQEGRTAVEDYLTNQRSLYGEDADFAEQVSVTQEFKTQKADCATVDEAEVLLAENTTLTVPAAVIVIEGNRVVAVADEESAYEILDSLKNKEKVISEAVEVVSSQFKGNVEVITERVPVTEVRSMNEAQNLLVDNADLADSLEVIVEYKETVAIEEGTTVIPSDSLAQGSSAVVAEGHSGTAENTVRAVVSDGNITQECIVASQVLSEPRSEVVIEGTDEVFYDVAANGGLGASDIPLRGEITATYGSLGTYWASSHTGMDIAAPQGTAICSLGQGVVTLAQWNGSYGNMVIVDHGNGVETRYGHMESVNVSPGDNVEIGSVIGFCGSTGNATGSHLHLEVKVNGELQDPALFF